jgi:plastocyanin
VFPWPHSGALEQSEKKPVRPAFLHARHITEEKILPTGIIPAPKLSTKCRSSAVRNDPVQENKKAVQGKRFSPDRPEKDKKMSNKTKLILGFTIAVFMISAMFAAAPRLSASPQQAATAEVKIDNFSFGPATLTVAPGTTVTWVNHDDIPHTVVSTDGFFKSKVLDTDEKFSFTFAKAGTYPYFCSIHPKMTASVVVK